MQLYSLEEKEYFRHHLTHELAFRPRANDAVKRLFSEADDSSNERAKKSAKSHECRISSRTGIFALNAC